MPGIELPVTNPVLIIALVMGTVLVAPLLSTRFRIPGIVGLILAGVLIGPHVLGLLARDLTMQVLGTIGLLYIMFLAGLEINLHEFDKYRTRSVVLGLLSFALPQGVGVFVARGVLGFGWLEAVLLGSVFASHTLLAYPAVARLGITRSQAVTVTVGATIVTDTLALLVLAVVARMADGSATPAFWVFFATVFALYVFAMLWGLPRLGQWFFRRLHAGEVSEFVFILATAFVCAFLAELAGVEAIIGAFLAGLGLNRLVPERSALMGRIRFVGEALFIPFFLISVGMLVDPLALTGDARAWLIAIVMTATVIATKWLAATGTRPLFGYSSDEASLVFGLTVPQAAATLAATLIGYHLGLFNEDVLNGSILMILVTCLLGPWLAERSGRRVALRMEADRYVPTDAPQRILVPLANPATEPHLVDLAIMIRDANSIEPIFPLTIARDGLDVKLQVAAGERLLAYAVMRIAAADIPVLPITRVDEKVASGVLRAVKEQLITTIVIGWSGHGAPSRSVFGSMLDELLVKNQEMVLVSKIEEPLNTVKRLFVLIPPYVERDPGFGVSIRAVKQLASNMGATLVVMAESSRMEEVTRRLEWEKPAVSTRFVELSNWGAASSELENEWRRSDMLVLLSVREGTRAWRPTQEQLSRRLAEQFADSDFIALYLPVYGAEGAPSSESVPPITLRERHVAMGMSGTSTSELFRALLEHGPGNTSELRRNFETTNAVQIVYPGILFHHGHVAGLADTLLLIGICNRDVEVTDADGPVDIVLAMFSPEDEPSERHLQRLAGLAGALHTPGVVEALRSALSAAEVVQVLEQGIYGGAPRRPSHA